ncbi:MAG: hypothetical protein JWM31_1786 [Solirubrobacterales bacterium]|nr:hypothetical protein [Solirubrobacterales bacterium]
MAPRLTAHRATIAGIGSTAALLAAVVAVSLIVGGLVAYTASPDGPLATSEPALSLPGRAPSPGATDGQALVVPAAAARRAPTATRPAGSGPGTTPRAVRQTAPTSGERTPASTGTSTGPAGTGRPPSPVSTASTTPSAGSGLTGLTGLLPAEPVKGVTSALAETTDAVGTNLGGGLQQTVAGLGRIVGGLLPPLAPTLEKAAQGANAAITGTTDTLSDLVRGLGGTAPGAPAGP